MNGSYMYGCLQSKLKKMKEKYKDQDDEERELRMQLLAVSDVPGAR